ncbi:glycosyltransferase [Aquincola sp. MAHUQ-54]|uniref:Glycosyltransferase n=1 Tax=Aquincola agrisoli TaxID=3119538 RepID=A0AAW9QH74_9BURK
MNGRTPAMRLALLGDGESPHLLKWARALSAEGVDLWAASSRGFAPAFDEVLPSARRLALGTRPDFDGGNAAVLRTLPRLARWLRAVQPDWVHAHYLTSHGTLAWLAQSWLGAPGRIVGSAWGSDILVTPQRHAAMRWLTRRVLRACTLTTSDSQHMAGRMQALGAREVMTFPFGLDAMPPAPASKDGMLFFANRGLEPIYAPERVIDAFGAVASQWPAARLVVANDGSLRAALQARADAAGLAGRVRFTGRLDAQAQAGWYARARWYLSLPRSDSVSVSVLEAMAHGCVPILSDLPANRELVRHGDNGCLLADGALPDAAQLQALAARADAVAGDNRAWVAEHALFGPCVRRFVDRLVSLADAPALP